MTAEIRQARPQEYPAVAALTLAAYREYAEAMGPERWNRYAEELADVAARAADAQILVEVEAGRPVGAVALYPPARPAEASCGDPPDRPQPRSFPDPWAVIRVLAVDPSHRGRGTGRRLAGECIRRAREMGAPAVALWTTSLMEVARGMYERMGFRRIPGLEAERPTYRVYGYVLPLAEGVDLELAG